MLVLDKTYQHCGYDVMNLDIPMAICNGAPVDPLCCCATRLCLGLGLRLIVMFRGWQSVSTSRALQAVRRHGGHDPW